MRNGNKSIKIITAVLAVLAIAAAAFFAGFFTRKLTQGQTLSSVEWALDTLEKNYYYGYPDGDVADTMLSAIADSYLDRYSDYYTAEEYRALDAANKGSKSGLGFSYSYVSDRGVYLAEVVGNSPAYKCGLRTGMWLTSGSVAGGGEAEFDSAASFAELISGAADGETLTFVASDGKIYSAAKAAYTASYAYLCTCSTAWIFSDSADGGLAPVEAVDEKISYLPEGTAYLRLSQFYGGAAEEFSVLIEKFNAMNCDSLILDLRANGGGYVNVMQKIAGAFAGGDRRIAMVARDKNGNSENYYCEAVTDAQRRISADCKVYVLADSGTASASEALMGAMICYGALDYGDVFLSKYSDEYLGWLEESGQEIKTESTYGKGIMQSTFVNSTGEALKLTTAQIYWPDGKTCIHGRGITVQDGCVSVYAEWQRTADDEQLRSVVDVISGR